MPLYQVQVALKGKSGMPEDVYVNNFHFEADHELTINELDDLDGIVWDFYSTALPSGRRLSDYLSPAVQQGGHVIKIYNLDEVKPRVPKHTNVKGLSVAPAGTGLPEEVAITLSYRAQLESGTIPARRRGRLFFGPLDMSGLQADANSRAQITQNLRDDLLLCGERLWLAAGGVHASVAWVVHSPTSGPTHRHQIQHLWIDDAFDTIRARGRTPQIRHEFPLPSS